MARNSPETAEQFGYAVMEATRSLSELSERGRLVPELSDPSVREIFLVRYRIVYEVFPDHVGIVRIIHSSRDFIPAWGR